MADNVSLTDSEVGTRLKSTRQWVWTQNKKSQISAARKVDDSMVAMVLAIDLNV